MFVLLSRIFSQINIVISFFLALHVIVRIFFNGTLKITFNKLCYQDKTIHDKFGSILVLSCKFALTPLVVQLYMDPSITSSALVLYYALNIIAGQEPLLQGIEYSFVERSEQQCFPLKTFFNKLMVDVH